MIRTYAVEVQHSDNNGEHTYALIVGGRFVTGVSSGDKELPIDEAARLLFGEAVDV